MHVSNRGNDEECRLVHAPTEPVPAESHLQPGVKTTARPAQEDCNDEWTGTGSVTVSIKGGIYTQKYEDILNFKMAATP